MGKRIFLGLLTLLLGGFNLLCAQEMNVLNEDDYDIPDTSLFNCFYRYEIHTKNKKGRSVKETYQTILQVGEKAAKFWDYANYALDSVETLIKGATREQKRKYEKKFHDKDFYFEQEIVQNNPLAGTNTITDQIVPNKYFYYEDRGEMQWKISKEHKKILGYDCIKATTFYGGRKWEAWFAPKLKKYPYGPWKIMDLPGLVLYAMDSQKIHVFMATGMQKSVLPIYFKYYRQYIDCFEVKKEKFMEEKIKFEKDPYQSIPLGFLKKMDICKYGDGKGKKYDCIDSVRLRHRPNGYIPLELR